MARDENTNEPVLLIGVPDIVEANRIMTMLESFGIPSMKKADICGQMTEILTSSSATGYEIYVPDSSLPYALDLLGEQGIIVTDEADGGDELSDDTDDSLNTEPEEAEAGESDSPEKQPDSGNGMSLTEKICYGIAAAALLIFAAWLMIKKII